MKVYVWFSVPAEGVNAHVYGPEPERAPNAPMPVGVTVISSVANPVTVSLNVNVRFKELALVVVASVLPAVVTEHVGSAKSLRVRVCCCPVRKFPPESYQFALVTVKVSVPLASVTPVPDRAMVPVFSLATKVYAPTVTLSREDTVKLADVNAPVPSLLAYNPSLAFTVNRVLVAFIVMLVNVGPDTSLHETDAVVVTAPLPAASTQEAATKFTIKFNLIT